MYSDNAKSYKQVQSEIVNSGKVDFKMEQEENLNAVDYNDVSTHEPTQQLETFTGTYSTTTYYGVTEYEVEVDDSYEVIGTGVSVGGGLVIVQQYY